MSKLQNEMYLGGTYVETRVGLSFVTIFGWKLFGINDGIDPYSLQDKSFSFA